MLPPPELPRSVQSHGPLPRLRLVDRPLVLKDRLGPSTIRAAVRRRVPGGFSGARLRAPAGAILDALTQSHKLQGHDPPHRQQEIVRRRASLAYSRRNPPTHGPRARAAELRWTSATRWSVTCHYFPRVQLAIRATCAPVGRIRPWSVHPQRSWLVGNCRASGLATLIMQVAVRCLLHGGKRRTTSKRRR